jgi:hypothetical protein
VRRRLLAVVLVAATALLLGAGATTAYGPGCALLGATRGGRPSAGSVGVGPVSTNDAEFESSLTAGYEPTTFYYEYGTLSSYGSRTSVSSVDGCENSYSPSAVATGLQSSTTYYVRMVAINEHGTSDGPVTSFTTATASPGPPAPAHPLLVLRPSSSSIEIGDPLYVTVRLLGGFDAFQPVKVMFAPAPFHRWRVLANENPSPSGALRLTVEYPSGNPIDRNVRLRAEIGSDTSNTAEVYVNPSARLDVYRETVSSQDVTVGLDEYVHLARRYPHRVVFFYRRASTHDRWSLFGSRRLRAGPREGDGKYLGTTFSFYDPSRVYVDFCFRTPIFADMGHPFQFNACGRPGLG